MLCRINGCLIFYLPPEVATGVYSHGSSDLQNAVTSGFVFFVFFVGGGGGDVKGILFI